MKTEPPLLALLLALAGLPAFAHGVRLEAELVPPCVIIAASYEAGTAIPSASVRVYPPGEDALAHQDGRADTSGRFAFVPSRAGTWRVVVADGRGHRSSIEVAIDEAFLAGHASASRAAVTWPVLARWAVGMAIIFGVTGLIFWGKARALLRTQRGRP